MNFPIFRK